MKRADKKNKKKATTRKKVVALPLIKLKKSNKVKVSKTEKQRKEKLRIAKITATWARKSYQKLLQIKKPTGAQKKQRRQAYERLLKLNSRVIDIESKKPQFKKLTKTKGWITQNFGLPQRFENNFIQWFKLVGNTFKQINQYKLPSDAGLMFLYVAELSLNSGPYTELELKYQYDDNTKKNFGFLYIIENED